MTLHRTGSPLLDELAERRDTFLEKMWPRPARYWQFDKKAAKPESRPEQEPEPEIVPAFPFLPRGQPAFDSLPGPIAIRLIQHVTAQHFGIAVEEMLSARRKTNISRARMVAVYLSYKLTRRSTPDIGRRFGLDHSSVIYSVRRATSILERKPLMYGKRTRQVHESEAGLHEDIDVIKWMLGE